MLRWSVNNHKLISGGPKDPSHGGKGEQEEASPPTSERLNIYHKVLQVHGAPIAPQGLANATRKESSHHAQEENISKILANPTHQATTIFLVIPLQHFRTRWEGAMGELPKEDPNLEWDAHGSNHGHPTRASPTH